MGITIQKIHKSLAELEKLSFSAQGVHMSPSLVKDNQKKVLKSRLFVEKFSERVQRTFVDTHIHAICRQKGAGRRLNSQKKKKNLEVVESVGVSGKVYHNKTVKYFSIEGQLGLIICTIDLSNMRYSNNLFRWKKIVT